METKTEPLNQKADTNDDVLDHLSCEVCYPRGGGKVITLCGLTLEDTDEDEPYYDEGTFKCVVCDDLEYKPCEGCGL